MLPLEFKTLSTLLVWLQTVLILYIPPIGAVPLGHRGFHLPFGMRIKELKNVAKREFQNGRWIPEPPGFWDDDDNFPHRVSDKCTNEQVLWHRIGWLEAGYLAKGFHLALKDMKYERIVGHFFGEDWKTDINKDTIIGNFARAEALHRGGKDFKHNAVAVYCGGFQDNPETLRAYYEDDPHNNCIGDEILAFVEHHGEPRFRIAKFIGWLVGFEFNVERMYLCPAYFKSRSLRQRAADVSRSSYQQDLLKTFYSFGVAIKGATEFHEHMHFRFIGIPDVRDINRAYGIERAHDLALSSIEYALANADNYALAVLCIAVVWMFNLHEIPDFRLEPYVNLLVQLGYLPDPSKLKSPANVNAGLKPGAADANPHDYANHEGGVTGNYTDVTQEIGVGDFERFSEVVNTTSLLNPGLPDLELPNKPGWDWLQFQLHEIQAPEPLPTSL